METRRKFLATAGAALVTAPALVATGAISKAEAAEETWTWKGQAFCSRANRLYELGEDFGNMITKYTNGRVKIQFHQAGEMVPAGQVFDAAGQGIIDFGQGCPCLAKSKAYAAQWFCDAPGAQSPIEKIIWYYNGGGKQILEDIFHRKYNSHPLFMIAITAEIWIYSNKKVNTIDDIKGLKIRAAGVRGEVLQKFGAAVVVLPEGEMVPAMERKVIDAMEYASINITYPVGFCDVTKYLYMHPSKSTSPINLWAVNLDKWKKLPPDMQKAIEQASKDATFRSLAWGIEQDTLTLKKAVEEKKSEVLVLPAPVTKAVDEACADYTVEKAKTDKDLARIVESWTKFKKDYGKYGKWIDFFNMTGDHIGFVKGDF